MAGRRLSTWQTESMIDMETARRMLPQRPSLRTIHRWSNPDHGCPSAYERGQHVVLESVMVGGRQKLTSKEAIERFVARLNGDAE